MRTAGRRSAHLDVPIIVVLGAPNDDQGNLLPVAAGRAQTALLQHRQDPSARLLLTGGFGAHFNNTARPHFEYVEDYLRSRGVPGSAILGRLRTVNTIEDAEKSAQLLRQYVGPLQLRVVSSDFHLARARLLFERAFGEHAALDMIAAPSGLPPDELARALKHESEAIARLAAPESATGRPHTP